MSESINMKPLNIGKSNVGYSRVVINDESGVQSIDENQPNTRNQKDVLKYWLYSWALAMFIAFCFVSASFSASTTTSNTLESLSSPSSSIPFERGAISSEFPSFSVVDPLDLGVNYIDRSEISKPGKIFGDYLLRDIPLPTNSWCENFFLGKNTNDESNKVFQVPYVVDTAGPIPGLRVHSANVKTDDRSVIMNFEPLSGITLGAVEDYGKEHVVRDGGGSFARLAIELEWKPPIPPSALPNLVRGPSMRAPIVRGSPYGTMEYYKTTPLIVVERSLLTDIVVDEGKTDVVIKCNTGKGNYSGPSFLVEKEVMLKFEISDHTWMVFVSQPTHFVCTNTPLPPVTTVDMSKFVPGVVLPPPPGGYKLARFELKSVKPMAHGIVRVALANNCTVGISPVHCFARKPRDPSEAAQQAQLLREHADIYPTGRADVRFGFPVDHNDREKIELHFEWVPAVMSLIGGGGDARQPLNSLPPVELLMYALPHHQDNIIPKISSSNKVLSVGCVPTLHGLACPVVGGSWSIQESLSKVSLHAERPIRADMIDNIKKAAVDDLTYEVPLNYRKGAGDTYFSGKMIAKLARVIVVADEVGIPRDSELMQTAISNLRQSTEIWLNGSAKAPLLYDPAWGGIVGCGCDYDGELSSCHNSFPNCPALEDAGQNFGSGFYNDHHFHYGYHIYAAAVLVEFDSEWARKFHERVLLLIRDIANPSAKDPFFPTWRHKDWYLGSSWASGIVTIGGTAYPNGRNQESSAESIHAYEAVALYGQACMGLFLDSANVEDQVLYQNCLLVKEMGRLLLGTEIRSAQRYWHVRAAGPGVKRVYPEMYRPKVVGMLWSMLAQEQTWFGNEQWKSYGIQMMPITPSSEERDDLPWIQEMLPEFNASCFPDKNCKKEGWSILVHASQASLCHIKDAEDAILELPDSAFLAAGGNGHSRTNTLWWIATRNCN